MDIFQNRSDAGRQLAQKLAKYAQCKDAVVLGLPRGGVPVAFEIAQVLLLPLDILLVRKLGAPMQPELAIGPIATGGITVLDRELIRRLGITDGEVAAILAQESEELWRREELYKRPHGSVSVRDRHVILVDDGVATG